MEHLLVDGYIRTIQKIVTQIIPYPINQLCLQFYFVSKRMIVWSRKFNNLYITDFDIDITNNDNQIKVHQNYKCSVYSMEGRDMTISDSWQVYEPGICYNSNVKFSKLMSQKINATFNKLNTCLYSRNDYETVFKCGGGTSNHCHAMLIHPQQFYDIKQNDIMAINLTLPSLPQGMQTNALIFCEYYGCLISIGGELSSTRAVSSVYRLSFDESMDNENEWKWVELNEMSQGRVAPSAVMIDDHRFIVIGGYNEYATDSYSNIVEMYDLEINGWNTLAPMNIGRSDTTSCFDKNLNKVYVVGSDGAVGSDIVEEYDINKNVWSTDNIPNTISDHGDCSTLWMEDANNLAITSSMRNVMEIIDLRENNKSWKLIDDKTLLQTLYGKSFPKKDISSWIVMN